MGIVCKKVFERRKNQTGLKQRRNRPSTLKKAGVLGAKEKGKKQQRRKRVDGGDPVVYSDQELELKAAGEKNVRG